MTEFKTIQLLGGILLLFTLFHTSSCASFQDVPCPFIDTVDLRRSTKFPNGSYSYDGLIVPPHLVGIFEHTSNHLSQRVPAESHARGCVCKLRPCVKLCCPIIATFDGIKCIRNPGNARTRTLMNITTSSGKLQEVDLANKFSIQYGKPCASMYAMEPHIYDFDGFSLWENGSLWKHEDINHISKDEFCLSSYTNPAYNLTDILLPMQCLASTDNKSRVKVCGWVMMFSVPFLILTIIVYMTIPELRTLHGKALCCYLLGLSIGYTILSLFIIIPSSISQFQCKAGGFLAYFSLMASFLWLSVISYDLFFNIHDPRRRLNEKKRFICYSVYAWGLALVALGLTYAAQHSSFIPDVWKPQIGSEAWCWLNVKYGWSAMIYFHGPIIVILAFNIVMFILTAVEINEIQKEMKRFMKQNDIQKNLPTNKDRFALILRLFIVMGVTWSMEITSYLVGADSSWSKIFIVTDVGNGIQGFIIFILLVLKKNVIRNITNRCFSSIPERGHPSQSSFKTISSTSNVPLNDMGADKPV